MNNLISVDFSVNATTSLGEEVYICGNIFQLGHWKVSNALKLYTNKTIYPEWKNRDPLNVQPQTSLQFKLFIKSSSGNIRWQKVQDNRKFVPTQGVIINFTQSKPNMSFQSKQPKKIQQHSDEEKQKVIKKKTNQIILDLSDQVSQSSSGHQRQFWIQKGRRQRATISSSREFVTDAKLLFQIWTPQRTKPKQKVLNSWLKAIPIIHYIFKINKQAPSSKKQNNHKQKKQIKSPKLSKHPVAVNQQTNIIQICSLSSLEQPDDILKVFHIQPKDWTLSDMKMLNDKYEGQFVLYLLDPTEEINEEMISYAQIIIIRNKNILKQCLFKFQNKKHHSISMIKQNHFLIKKIDDKSVIIHYQPNLMPSSNKNPIQIHSQIAANYDYLSSIQKNILTHKNFQLPQNLRLSLFVQRKVHKQVRDNKFCIVILCQKLQQIPQKIITKLIRISSRQNVSVNIMTVDDLQQIFRKLPVSDVQKLLVYNRSGQVFKPGKKPCNLYDYLHVNHKQYQDIFNKFKQKANFWVQNREIQIVQSPLSLEFVCSRSVLGQAIAQNLSHELSKSQQLSQLPLIIQKYYLIQHNRIVIHLRPLLSSTQFYTTIISSININAMQKTYFLCFDYTRDKYKFIQKMENATADKSSICEGFIMEGQKGVTVDKSVGQDSHHLTSIGGECHRLGLKNQKLVEFLEILMMETYDIIQQDFELDKTKQKNKKEGIRSDVID